MQLNIFFKTFINLLWILQVSLGFKIQPRIVNGKNAGTYQIPYQISLRVNGSHLCGGSIISQNYIVTAAHCVTFGGDPTKKFTLSTLAVRAGSINVNSGGVVIGVSQIIPHPMYSNAHNDIAVLKLSQPLQFTDNIKPITLATESLRVGDAVVTSGWGRLYTNGPGPDILQHITLRAISYADCTKRVGVISTSLICLVPAAGQSVCHGDSGGPAVFSNKLYGVTALAWGGCASGKPNGFTKIPTFVNWIKNNTDL